MLVNYSTATLYIYIYIYVHVIPESGIEVLSCPMSTAPCL